MNFRSLVENPGEIPRSSKALGWSVPILMSNAQTGRAERMHHVLFPERCTAEEISHTLVVAVPASGNHNVTTNTRNGMDILRAKTVFLYPKDGFVDILTSVLERRYTGNILFHIGLFKLGHQAFYAAFTHAMLWEGKPSQGGANYAHERVDMARAYPWASKYRSVPTGSQARMSLVHAMGDDPYVIAPEILRQCIVMFGYKGCQEPRGFPVSRREAEPCMHDWQDKMIQYVTRDNNVEQDVDGEVCVWCGLTREAPPDEAEQPPPKKIGLKDLVVDY